MTAIITAGMVLTPARLNIIKAIKGGDTSRNTTALHSADPDLTVAVEADAIYRGECVLFCTSAANAAGDLSVRFSMPTGAAITYGLLALTETLASGTDADLTARAVETSTSPTTSVAIGCSTSLNVARIEIVLDMAATAGSLTLLWAQWTSNANNTTLKARSYLALERIA